MTHDQPPPTHLFAIYCMAVAWNGTYGMAKQFQSIALKVVEYLPRWVGMCGVWWGVGYVDLAACSGPHASMESVDHSGPTHAVLHAA